MPANMRKALDAFLVLPLKFLNLSFEVFSFSFQDVDHVQDLDNSIFMD